MPDFVKALRSFRYAIRGIFQLFSTENNAKIHLIAGILAIFLGLSLGLSRIEWCILIIQITVVFAAEAFNSAIEKLADVLSPEHHPVVGILKDIAAGGVLLVAAGSVLTGILLFLPRILDLLS